MKGVLIGGAVTTNASQPTEFDGLIDTSSVSDGELSGGYGIIGRIYRIHAESVGLEMQVKK